MKTEFKWQDENRINNKSCWLDSIKAIVTWATVTSLKPGQACFPRMDCHGADGAGEGVPASEPCPMDLWACSPLPGPTTSRSRRVLLQWNYGYCTQRIWSLWAERALKNPVGSMSPGGGVPTSSLLSLPSTDESTLPRVVLQERGCVQGRGVRNEEGMGHKL